MCLHFASCSHGGGYQFRLCPANAPLTEDCFKKTPLAFAGGPTLRWNNGTELSIKGTFVSEGTSPPGSVWQMNPIPRIDFDSTSSGQPADFKACNRTAVGLQCRQFEPPCKEQVWPSHGMPWHGTSGANRWGVDVQGDCSGDLTAAALVDHVVVPKDLPAGDYILGFRCTQRAEFARAHHRLMACYASTL